MRHVWSLLAGVVAAPLTWLLIALGQGGSSSTIADWVDDGRYDTSRLVEPAAYLAVAGLVLGLVGTLRISPLGPLVAGSLLVAPYGLMFVDPFAVHDTLPANEEVFGRTVPLHLPLDNGTLFLVGTLLMVAVASAQRWRRWPAASPDAAAATGADGSVATEPGTADLEGAPRAGRTGTGGAPTPGRTAALDAPAPATPATPEAPAAPEPARGETPNVTDTEADHATAGLSSQTTGTSSPTAEAAGQTTGAAGQATGGPPRTRRLTPLPRRPDTRSPWSTPPQPTGRREPEEAASE